MKPLLTRTTRNQISKPQGERWTAYSCAGLHIICLLQGHTEYHQWINTNGQLRMEILTYTIKIRNPFAAQLPLCLYFLISFIDHHEIWKSQARMTCNITKVQVKFSVILTFVVLLALTKKSSLRQQGWAVLSLRDFFSRTVPSAATAVLCFSHLQVTHFSKLWDVSVLTPPTHKNCSL